MELIFYSFSVIFAFCFGKWRSLRIMEYEGEGLIRRLLTSTFDSEQFHLLNNVTLKVVDGTTQIDHILVSTRGIFIIESKHYSHWIFGDEKSKNWTQVLPGGLKYRFQNPLRQNFKHLKAVQACLEFLPPEVFHPIVVFTGNAKFKTNRPMGVLSPATLVQFIRGKSNGALSQDRVAFSVGRLECARYSISKETDIEHQAKLEQRFGKPS